MAKNKEKTVKTSKSYVFAAILLTITTFINTTLVAVLFSQTVLNSQKSASAMTTINKIDEELLSVNTDILLLVSRTKSFPEMEKNIESKFENISLTDKNFNSAEILSETANGRYLYSMNIFEAYKQQYNKFKEIWNGEGKTATLSQSEISERYIQELYPVQITTCEMLASTIDIASADIASSQAQGSRIFILTEFIIVLVYFVSLAAVFLLSKSAKKSQAVLEEREKNLAEVDAKLKSTRQKASDLALSNLLTGTKNRYALSQDLTPRLESERFNIAVFDMDNFRSINDTYGYEFGDEYLASVAEKLKEQFSGIAEIYSITGNEFCFLFNKDVSENQAMAHAQSIRNVMASPYNVMNLTVQLTVSGAVYHYLPGDCLNVNSLLVKLDTTMRNVKLNGGNMITSVVNI